MSDGTTLLIILVEIAFIVFGAFIVFKALRKKPSDYASPAAKNGGGTLSPSRAKEIDRLIDRLLLGDDRQAINAADQLGRLRAQEAIPALTAVAQGEARKGLGNGWVGDRKVDDAAVHALGEIGGDRARQALLKINPNWGKAGLIEDVLQKNGALSTEWLNTEYMIKIHEEDQARERAYLQSYYQDYPGKKILKWLKDHEGQVCTGIHFRHTLEGDYDERGEGTSKASGSLTFDETSDRILTNLLVSFEKYPVNHCKISNLQIGDREISWETSYTWHMVEKDSILCEPGDA